MYRQTIFSRTTKGAAMSNILGQTGRHTLSEEALNYRISAGHGVRYQFSRYGTMWMAWVCGPFHSRTYGVCGVGTTKAKAKVALRNNLADNYGYHGAVSFSDVDSADNVAVVDIRLWDDRDTNRPITARDACGAVGW